MDTFGGEAKKPNPNILHSEVEDELKNKLTLWDKSKTFDLNGRNKLVTLMQKNKKGDIFKLFKLAPILIGSEIYY